MRASSGWVGTRRSRADGENRTKMRASVDEGVTKRVTGCVEGGSLRQRRARGLLWLRGRGRAGGDFRKVSDGGIGSNHFHSKRVHALISRFCRRSTKLRCTSSRIRLRKPLNGKENWRNRGLHVIAPVQPKARRVVPSVLALQPRHLNSLADNECLSAQTIVEGKGVNSCRDFRATSSGLGI